MNKLTERLVLGAGALVIGLIVGWAVRGVATYGTTTETVTTYQDWRTACPPSALKDQKCQMIEDVLDKQTQQPVVRVALSSENGTQELGLTLPFGVALEPGLGLVLGTDKPILMRYRTCNQVGCISVLPLDDKLLAAMASSKDGRILVEGLDAKPVAIPISFKGYGDAMHAYRSAEAKRSSWFWRLWS